VICGHALIRLPETQRKRQHGGSYPRFANRGIGGDADREAGRSRFAFLCFKTDGPGFDGPVLGLGLFVCLDEIRSPTLAAILFVAGFYPYHWPCDRGDSSVGALYFLSMEVNLDFCDR